MSAGRRGLLLSVAFLGLACWLCSSRPAQAQPGGHFGPNGGIRPHDPGAGRHIIWQTELSPNQIRDVLAKFGQDDGKNDWFEKMLFDAVKEKNRGADDKEVEAAIKRLLSNKEFMDRVVDMAQKHKNQMPNPGNGGPAPKLSPEDLAKLAKAFQGAQPGGDPFKLPDRKLDPNAFPPFDPRNPLFDPKRFPAIDPDNPPQFDPKTKFPLDPNNGRPFDPRTGDPIDPKNPPKIEPIRPQVDPKNPTTRPDDVGQPKAVLPPKPRPQIDPKTGRPTDPPNPADPANPPDTNRKFDPENPLGTPNESPEKMAKTKAVETATALWEKNVGPIEESPAVKRAIIDLVSDNDAMEALTDGKGNNIFDFLKGETGDGEKLGDWFGQGGDSGWEWPKLNLDWGRGRNTDWNIGDSRPRDSSSRDWGRHGSSSSSFNGPSFNFGGVAVPWVLVLILFLVIVAAVVWWKWGTLFQPKAAVVFDGGPGPWPIDPRAINTREDVVKAFEYLSVMICGPGAKTWTHSTIAEELSALAATHGETAVKLARLYELARYAPLDEPLTRAELLEARRLVCDLAGMDEV